MGTMKRCKDCGVELEGVSIRERCLVCASVYLDKLEKVQREGRWHTMERRPDSFKELWFELTGSSVAVRGFCIREGLMEGYWRLIEVGVGPTRKMRYEVCNPLRWAYVVRPELVEEEES